MNDKFMKQASCQKEIGSLMEMYSWNIMSHIMPLWLEVCVEHMLEGWFSSEIGGTNLDVGLTVSALECFHSSAEIKWNLCAKLEQCVVVGTRVRLTY